MAKKSTFLFVLALVAMLGFMVSPALAGPKKGGTLVVGGVVDLVGLDPHKVRAESSVRWLNCIYERLVEMDEKSNPMPGLAKSWTISKDGLTYTFKLRKGVKFHNGREMTADDVIYSYKRMANPKTGTAYVSHIRNIAKMRAVDKYTVEFVMKKPTATFMIFTANQSAINAIVPKEEVEKQNGTLNHPVGTGPYKFVEYVPDKHIIIERFDGYVQPDIPTSGSGGKKPAYLKKIIYRPIKDSAVRNMALKKGEIHYATRIGWEEFEEMDKNPNVVAYEGPGLSYVFLGFGVKKAKNPFIKKAKFRKAIGYCLDLKEVVEGAVFGHSTPNPSLVGAALPYYSDVHKKGYGRNIKKAKALLKEVGYDGTPVRLSVCKRYIQTYKTAIVVQQMMADAGINVKMDVLEWAALLREFKSGEYDMQSFVASAAADPSLAMRRVHSKRTFAGYKNEKLDALAEKAEVVNDFKTRKKLYEQVHMIMLEDAPVIKIFDHSVAPAARKEVKGVLVWPHTANNRYWTMWLEK
ncbi:MAG: ABC transporter substrate-binding protein [Desulfarculaceae bacterium]|jgi:peptide/nickel transport system substrate-binding protein